MQIIKFLYYKIPLKQRRVIRNLYFGITNISFKYRPEEGLLILKLKLLLYYKFHPKIKEKYINEIDFIKKKAKNGFSYSFIFPYDYTYNIFSSNVIVKKDISNGLYYVNHYGKKLYFNDSFISKSAVKSIYFCLLVEQHETSPHKYLHSDFGLDNSIVADVGAAEGIFGLDNIENIKKLFLFEADKKWIKALKATFEPWKDKVEIINNFVSNRNNGKYITLDNYFSSHQIDFIKIDVEGSEYSILEGSKNILTKENLKVVICTYHKQEDARNIKGLLEMYNYNCSYSSNFMLYIHGNLDPPYFRHGLIRAKISNNE